jgi:hypothetical protein
MARRRYQVGDSFASGSRLRLITTHVTDSVESPPPEDES